MPRRNAKQVVGLIVLAGALLLAPLAHAQRPTPPPPRRVPGYEVSQPPLPLLPGAQPQEQAGDLTNAPACAPWTKLAFAAYHGNSWDVYVANGDGSGKTQLTDRDGTDSAPKFNRGCTRLVYHSYRGKQYEIYAMNADGSSQTRLTNNSANDAIPCWSPNGARIAFQSDRDGDDEVYVMNANGTGQTRLTNHPAYDGMPAWSPDGTQIAFVSRRSGQYEVWVMNADGTGQTKVTSGVQWAQYPCWSPDGARIAFSNDDNGDGFMDIDVVNADGTGFTHVAGHTNSVDYWYPAWSPDGEWIAYGRTELIYYQGNWYWTRSDIYAKGAPGYGHAQAALVASGRDWRPHWGTLDAQAPTSEVHSLSAETGLLHLIRWSGQDTGPAGIGSYDVQYRDGESGPWMDWLTNVSYEFANFGGVSGHKYYFRCRARDRAGNLEPYPSTGPYPHTTFYTYHLSGCVRDTRDTPVTNAVVDIVPPPLHPATADSTSNYEAYLTGLDLHTIDVSKANYGSLPPMSIPATQILQPVTTYLPPVDDQVQNGGFEAGSSTPSGWSCQGAFPPTLVSTVKHTGNHAVRLGLPPSSLLAPASKLDTHTGGAVPQIVVDRNVVHVTRQSASGIYYIQRTSDGAWLSPKKISSSGFSVQLAMDEGRVLHAIWCHPHVTTARGDVWYARRESNGTWTNPRNLSDNAGDSAQANLTVDTSGTVHVVWQDDTPGNREIYYTSQSGVGPWATPRNISINNRDSIHANLIVDKSGTVHVVWQDATPGNYDIYYTNRSDAGSWTRPQNISNTPTPSQDVRLTIDENGHIHIIWNEGSSENADVYYAQRSPSGVWSDPQDISNISGPYKYSQLTADTDGNVHVVWYVWDNGDVYYIRRNSSGTWSSPQNISNNPGTSRAAQLAVDGDGIVHVVWYDNTLGGFEINYARRASDGTWSSPLVLSDGISGFSRNPELTTDGSVHVVWEQGLYYDVIVYYAGPTDAEQSGDSIITQMVTIPTTMLSPTLSLLYQLGGGASATSGTGFRAQVDDGITITTLLSATANTDTWTQNWFDLGPWAGQNITLTFNVHNQAGVPHTWAYLDEVSLGSAYPNLWVQKASPSVIPPGGGTVQYTIAYGNLGGVPAQSVRLTDTLPAGVAFVSASPAPTSTAPLVWDVGDLAAGEGPHAIAVTGTVGAGVPAWTTLSNTVTIGADTPEADMDNNTAVTQTFVGYRLYLPLATKGW